MRVCYVTKPEMTEALRTTMAKGNVGGSFDCIPIVLDLVQLVLWCIYVSLGLNELIVSIQNER